MSDEERRRSVSRERSRERSPAGDRERRPDADQPREEPPREKEEFKCFVGGIPWQVNDSGLREIFAEFNPTDATVMLEKRSGRSRGFGFCWFADEASREAAIDKLHGTEIEGRKISVSKAIPQSQTAPGTPADALRRGQTVPRDQGRVRRGGGDRDHGRDRHYNDRGSYRRDYDRDRDDRGRDYYRDSYDRDRYSYRSGGGYDRGYSDRGGYGSSYGYDRGPSSDAYEPRSYDRGYHYDDRRSDRYYEPYQPRDSSYEPRPPQSRYEPAAPPTYYNGGSGAAPPPRDTYGSDRYDRPAY